MMPVTRINDATFADLKVIATWLGTGTPSETIDALVREKMDALDLERDVDDATTVGLDSDGDLVFETTPGLTFNASWNSAGSASGISLVVVILPNLNC